MNFRQSISIVLLSTILFTADIPVSASAISSDDLHALSAVLMDGDSGRVLYEKSGDVPRPNASTTKVMTCILALENGSGDDYVRISANAASQPEVQLGLSEGEQYYLEDLLYSLMLQSHNDSAVAIAECIGGSVEAFSSMMNTKAKEIGCKNTHFITPNGLDAEDSEGTHHTTAEDLALIMRYAVQSDTFRRITQTEEYSFTDLSGKRRFTVHNTNALLHMTDGVLSGKTGYTGDAGYCYVCACQKDDRIFIVSLLGAGWPGHRTYKWQDTLKLLDYGNNNYTYKTFWKDPELPYLPVRNAAINDFGAGSSIYTGSSIAVSESEKNQKILVSAEDSIRYQLQLKNTLKAPVRKGEQIGRLICLLNNEKLFSWPITATQDISKNTFIHCAELIFRSFFH